MSLLLRGTFHIGGLGLSHFSIRGNHYGRVTQNWFRCCSTSSSYSKNDDTGKRLFVQKTLKLSTDITMISLLTGYGLASAQFLWHLPIVPQLLLTIGGGSYLLSWYGIYRLNTGKKHQDYTIKNTVIDIPVKQTNQYNETTKSINVLSAKHTAFREKIFKLNMFGSLYPMSLLSFIAIQSTDVNTAHHLLFPIALYAAARANVTWNPMPSPSMYSPTMAAIAAGVVTHGALLAMGEVQLTDTLPFVYQSLCYTSIGFTNFAASIAYDRKTPDEYPIAINSLLLWYIPVIVFFS